MSTNHISYQKLFDYDLFEKNSINTVSEYLCPLCSGVLYNAVVDTCGHVFCSTCINTHLTLTKTCPVSKTDYTSSDEEQIVHPLPLIRSIVNKQKIKCKNKCQWIGPAGDLEKHLENECPYSTLKCSYSPDGCPVILMRSEKLVHEKECKYKPTLCEHCGEKINTKILKEHESICPNLKIDCNQNCGLLIERKDFQKHVETTCPNTMAECMYSKLGCAGKFLRKNEKTHYETNNMLHCRSIVQHLIRILDSIEELKKTIHGGGNCKNGNEAKEKKHVEEQGEMDSIKKSKEKYEKLISKHKASHDHKFTGKKRERKSNCKESKNETNLISGSEEEESSKMIPATSCDALKKNSQSSNSSTAVPILDNVNISKGIQVNENRAITIPIPEVSSTCRPEHKFVFANMKLNGKESQWKVILVKRNGWLGIGACVKEIVIGNNYKFTPNIKGFDHGCFMISTNGYTWNRNCDGENRVIVEETEIAGLLNKKGCEVTLKYSSASQKLQINMGIYKIILTNVYPPKEMQIVPCVVFLKEGEEMLFIAS